MAFGPGKYDEACTLVREQTKAEGVIVIVVRGKHGDGFSAQLTAADMMNVPAVLRSVADNIEKTGWRG